MREVLFRAKRLGDGRWQEGYYIHLHHTTYCCDPDKNDGEDNQIHRIVYEEMTRKSAHKPLSLDMGSRAD